jgi:hypothetical protein
VFLLVESTGTVSLLLLLPDFNISSMSPVSGDTNNIEEITKKDDINQTTDKSRSITPTEQFSTAVSVQQLIISNCFSFNSYF